MKLINLILLICCILPAQVLSTTFAHESLREIHLEEPGFLKKFGLVSSSEKEFDDQRRAYVVVKFDAFKEPSSDDFLIELLLLDSDGRVMLAIENPFPEGQSKSRYVISPGCSLLVSIANNLKSDTTYHKVIFSSP